MGKEVLAKTSVNLDFSQQFYTDMLEFKTNSIIYNTASDTSSSEYTAAQEYLNNFTLDNYSDTYKQGFSKDDIYTTTLTWSSIGMAAIFLVCMAIIYVLIFFFKRIKNWVFGNHSRRTQRIVPNRPKEAASPQTSQKTQYDKVNEIRAEDMAKKRAREEEIRKQGNMIAGASKPAEEVQNDAPVIDAEIVETPENTENTENTETKEN